MNAEQIDERKKEGGGGNTSSFHYPIFFIQSLTRKWHFLDKYSSYFPCQMNRMKNTSRQIVVAMLYMDCIYRRILKLNFCSFFYWFSLWVSQFFMSLNIRHRNCVIYVYFSVFIGRKCCVHTCMYRRIMSAGMRDTCICEPWCRVLKNVSKIVFYEILIMFGINFTRISDLFTRLWCWFLPLQKCGT